MAKLSQDWSVSNERPRSFERGAEIHDWPQRDSSIDILEPITVPIGFLFMVQHRAIYTLYKAASMEYTNVGTKQTLLPFKQTFFTMIVKAWDQLSSAEPVRGGPAQPCQIVLRKRAG